MISAAEARAQMNEINSAKEKAQLAAVEQLINEKLKDGQAWYSGQLCPAVSQKLIDLGYRVKFHSDQRDGSCTHIQW